MIRVSIVGTSCSGKTTLARGISSVMGIPHFELDAIHWLPNWTPRPIDLFRAAVEEATTGDRWVIDGNYSKVRDIIWSRATDVVWLNLPFPMVFWRAVNRTIRRVITQEELFAGNKETLRLAFFDCDSILWWVIRSHHRRRREYEMLLHDGDHLPFTVHEIRNSADQKEILERLSKSLIFSSAVY
jgi:adenylate kinase family enzyme